MGGGGGGGRGASGSALPKVASCTTARGPLQVVTMGTNIYAFRRLPIMAVLCVPYPGTCTIIVRTTRSSRGSVDLEAVYTVFDF